MIVVQMQRVKMASRDIGSHSLPDRRVEFECQPGVAGIDSVGVGPVQLQVVPEVDRLLAILEDVLNFAWILISFLAPVIRYFYSRLTRKCIGSPIDAAQVEKGINGGKVPMIYMHNETLPDSLPDNFRSVFEKLSLN